MRSRIKTGDLFQIRKNGRNYLALGKVTDTEGNDFIAATLNGNVDYSGKMKRRTGVGRGKVHILNSHNVKRIHGHRTVDIESVTRTQPRLRNHLGRTDGRSGVITEAPNVLAQIAELQASI